MANWTHDVVNNSEEHRAFANALGYAILNCGVIELFTYSYSAALSGKHVFGTGLAKKTFSERVSAIQTMLDNLDVTDDLRRKAKVIWAEARTIMRWRNTLAHNPITIFSISRADGTVEKYTAVVNMQKSAPEKVEQLEMSELSKIVNRAENIARDLSECLVEINEQVAQLPTSSP